MSWSRSSKLGLVALLLVLVAAVGVASGVSVTQEEAPEEAEVDQDVTVTVELQDLFAQESSWEVNGRTELENAQWTIELYEGDELVGTRESSGSQPDPVYLEEGITDADRVVVEIAGTAPAVGNYSDPATFLGGEVVQVVDGGSDHTRLSEQRIHHYTTGDPGSQAARAALDDANDTIQSARENGTDVSDAESTFQDAVSAYDGGNFADAVSMAEDAASQAEASGSDDGTSDDGTSDDGTSDDGTSDDGTSDDGTSDDGTSDDGTSDGSDSDGTDDSGGDADGSDDGSTDDASDDSSNDESESSDDGGDDGGLLWILLYAFLGVLILGGVGGAVWYYQQQQGPSRDPLG